MVRKGAQHIERSLARLAANQHGVVSFGQLLSIGLGADATQKRVRRGRLHRVHRGVFAVGHAKLTNEGKWIAAVLACGEPAVLSHRAAAALWMLLSPGSGSVDVTVPGNGGRRQRPGIRLHRSTTLTQPQTTRRANIPVTTPARTLLDLRSCATKEELGRARRQAEVLGYRLDGAAEIEPDLTRSELERRFLRLCASAALPSPEVNARVGSQLVDFLWRRSGLIAETDGYRYHRGRANFEHDRAREAKLAVAGYEVLRFTWRQIVNDGDDVVSALRARLTPALPGRSSNQGYL
jgi:very-short-patch-repair endonuclease/predicted transcriptional regulator of viral defense system